MSAACVYVLHREEEKEDAASDVPSEKLSIDEERQRRNVRIFVQRLAEVRT